MKGKKIIIFSIIINILLIGVIYNFIKKDYLNNEKIIVKGMTGTEYENNITSLNASHEEYANLIEESKKKIASALTDMGVQTSNQETLETMASNIRSISTRSPYIDIRNLTSNTSNEYFEFSLSSEKYPSGEHNFYNAVNGDGKLVNNNYGWEAKSPVTVTVKLKKHVPAAFLLNVSGETYTPYGVATANLVSYSNIEMHINNSSGRQYLFRPTCDVGESFSLTFNSGYEWTSFTDFHLRAF